MLPYEIKQTIKRYKKLLKKLRPDSVEYDEILQKLTVLKTELNQITLLMPEKEILIKQINELTPKYLIGIVDLKLYTIEQLKIHLNKLKMRL